MKEWKEKQGEACFFCARFFTETKEHGGGKTI